MLIKEDVSVEAALQLPQGGSLILCGSSPACGWSGMPPSNVCSCRLMRPFVEGAIENLLEVVGAEKVRKTNSSSFLSELIPFQDFTFVHSRYHVDVVRDGT